MTNGALSFRLPDVLAQARCGRKWFCATTAAWRDERERAVAFDLVGDAVRQ